MTADATSVGAGTGHPGQGDPRPNDAAAGWTPPGGSRVRLRRPASPFHVDLNPLIEGVLLERNVVI